MKYFLTPSSVGLSLDGNMPEGAVLITADQYLNQQNLTIVAGSVAEITDAEKQARLWLNYQGQAAQALTASESDVVNLYEAFMHGDAKATDTKVVAFLAWRRALKAITTQSSGTVAPIPEKPSWS